MIEDIRLDEAIFGKKEKPKRKRVRKKIPKAIKEMVWAKYIGMDKPTGKCYVCRRPIHFTNFEVGHNKAVAKGGSDNINNLRTICRSCNLAMGTTPIEVYKRKYLSKTTKKGTAKKKTAKKKKRRKTKQKDEVEEYLERTKRLLIG